VPTLRRFLAPEIAQGLVTVEGDQQRLLVRIKNRGMFPSGSAALDPRFQDILRRIGEGLKEEPGRVQVQGRIALAPPRLYEFDAAASGPIRQNLDLDAYARETALPLRPLTVVQEDGQPPVGDGLLRQWPRPAADVHKHYGYAFQWFALSALILGLYVWFQLIRPRRARRA